MKIGRYTKFNSFTSTPLHAALSQHNCLFSDKVLESYFGFAAVLTKRWRNSVVEKSVVLLLSDVTSSRCLPFPSSQTWKPWEGCWTADAAQMISGMCPSPRVSYYSVRSEFTLVFNIACLCCSQLEWKYLGFCSIAPGEESCDSKSPNLAAKISTHGCYCRPQAGRDGVWHLNWVCLEEFADVLKQWWGKWREENTPTSFLSRLRSCSHIVRHFFHLYTYMKVHLMQNLIEVVSFLLSMHLIWFSWEKKSWFNSQFVDVQKHPNTLKCCQWDSTGKRVSIRLQISNLEWHRRSP